MLIHVVNLKISFGFNATPGAKIAFRFSVFVEIQVSGEGSAIMKQFSTATSVTHKLDTTVVIRRAPFVRINMNLRKLNIYTYVYTGEGGYNMVNFLESMML